MALTEAMGNLLVHGRFGGLQVVQDGYDMRVAVPVGATHVEIQQETQFQNILWSLTGGAGTWFSISPGAKDEGGSPFRVALIGTPAYVYFRKARQIRHISFRPGISGHFKGHFDAAAGIPALADGEGYDKDYYLVTVLGTHDFGSGGISFLAGDWAIYDGSVWSKATTDPREGICDDVIGKLTVTFTED